MPSDHAHSYEHGHSHSHSHGPGHSHDHGGQSRSHSHSPGHSHDHGGRSHSHDHSHDHGHTHEQMDNPGHYAEREAPLIQRDFTERAFTVGIGGPVGSGKTALMLALCRALRDKYNIAAVTNDIFTREDADFLTRNAALAEDRIAAIETGGCPHAAIREDISANLQACEGMTARHGCQLVLVESGGDNLAANYSRELADYIIYVIDVAGGDKVPRKGGPGITQSDLFVINKTDLADAVGADLKVMERDAKVMRGDGPNVFAQVKSGVGVPEVVDHILVAYHAATRGAAARPLLPPAAVANGASGKNGATAATAPKNEENGAEKDAGDSASKRLKVDSST